MSAVVLLFEAGEDLRGHQALATYPDLFVLYPTFFSDQLYQVNTAAQTAEVYGEIACA